MSTKNGEAKKYWDWEHRQIWMRRLDDGRIELCERGAGVTACGKTKREALARFLRALNEWSSCMYTNARVVGALLAHNAIEEGGDLMRGTVLVSDIDPLINKVWDRAYCLADVLSDLAGAIEAGMFEEGTPPNIGCDGDDDRPAEASLS